MLKGLTNGKIIMSKKYFQRIQELLNLRKIPELCKIPRYLHQILAKKIKLINSSLMA